MSGKKNKNTSFLSIISVLFGILLGLLIIFYWFSYLDTKADPNLLGELLYLFLLIGLVLVFILISIFLASIFHELGHLLTGLFVGLDFEFFEIFPFQIYVEAGKLKFERLPIKEYKSLALGRVSMSLNSHVSKKALALHYGGGLFFNLLLGLISLGIFLLNMGQISIVLLFFGVFSLCNFYLGLVNLYPLGGGELYTDGDILRVLLWDEDYEKDEESIDFYQALMMEVEIYEGKEPKDLADFKLETGENIVLVQASILAFLRDTDRKDFASIASYIRFLDPIQRPVFNLDPLERLTYSMVYYSWISVDEEKVRHLIDYDHGFLMESDRLIGRLGLWFYEVYKYQRKIVSYKDKESLEEILLALQKDFEEDPNQGLGPWAITLMEDRWTDLSAWLDKGVERRELL